jgi:hypothetical protein
MRLTDEELDTLEAQAATWDAPLLPPGAWHCQSIDGALAKKAVAELRAARAELADLRPTVLQVAAEDDVLNCLLRGDSVEYIRAIRATSVSTLITQAAERAAARAMKGEE